MNKEKVLKILKQAIDIYEKEYLNNNILYVYKDKFNELKAFEANFQKNNFLHLTGIETKLKASQFYKMLKENKLKLSDFNLKVDGTTILKLNVICQLKLLLENPSYIGYSNNYIYWQIPPDMVVGTSKKIVLGFKKGVPSTLLSKDIRECTIENLKILFILRKKMSEKEYKETVYKYEKNNQSLENKLKNLKEYKII